MYFIDNKTEEDKKPRLLNNNDVKDSDSIENELKTDDDHCCWYTLKRENMDRIVEALEKIGFKFHNWQEQINHK
ncbi:unnamed protein product [Rotaria sordida]|uniref:Uncharacterized protein n=1 Tax=Rotaria sordida TaxID=392033 RepID=A0A815U222_9BILA|nr:unnamed protein product [Rotaria sordida]